MDHLFLKELVKSDAISHHAILKTDEVPLSKEIGLQNYLLFFFLSLSGGWSPAGSTRHGGH
jgi:hypothetical protein